MGSITSMFEWKQKYSKNPDDYWVHGIHYWPGEAIPYSKWNELLPDFVPRADRQPDPAQSECEGNRKAKRSQRDKHKELCLKHRAKRCQVCHKYSNVKYTQAQDINLNHLPGKQDTQDQTKDKCSSLFSDLPAGNNTSLFEDLPERQSDHMNSERIRIPTGERWKSSSYPFENLVLSGGGMKGYSYIGAVKALEDAGVMPHIKRFAGTSAGAMCCAALSVGYTAQEVCRFFFVDMQEAFNDQSCAPVCCFPKLYKRFGLHPGKNLLDAFGLIIAAKAGGNKELTFKQHHDQFDKELCIVACNVTKMTTEYCHYTTTPDLTIRQAVRMSMSVPFVYEPAKREIDGKIHYYIDGSAGDHFPIHVFDGPSVGPNFKHPVNPKTIGFYAMSEIDAAHLTWINTFGKEIPNKPLYMPHTTLARKKLKKQIKKRKRQQKDFNEKNYVRQLETLSHLSLAELGMRHYDAPNKTHVDTRNVLKYLIATFRLFLCSQVTCKLRPEDEHRTIPINVGYVEGHDYGVEPPDREFMLKQGYASARTFLQQHLAKQAEH